MSTERQNQYLDFLINSSFQGVNILFLLSFENKGNRIVHKIWEHMITFEKIEQVKEMITQLVVY